MVKIRDLSNKQILQQVVKYEKILDGLYQERDKRLAKGVAESELFTPEQLKKKNDSEVAKQPKASSKKESSEVSEPVDPLAKQDEGTKDSFSVNFDEDELQTMQDEAAKATEDEEEDHVGVTQLIRLTQDQKDSLKKK